MDRNIIRERGGFEKLVARPRNISGGEQVFSLLVETLESFDFWLMVHNCSTITFSFIVFIIRFLKCIIDSLGRASKKTLVRLPQLQINQLQRNSVSRDC